MDFRYARHLGAIATTAVISALAGTLIGGDTATASQTGELPKNTAKPTQQSPPNNTVRPSIRGTAQEGQTLVASAGTWTGTQPISYAVQFLRCNTAGQSCVTAAKASRYTLKAADVGHTIVFNVLATNSAGKGSANSAPTAVVRAAAPRNTSPPAIQGTAREGETLTVSNGSWTGSGPIAYSYQWTRCSATLANCQPISGATKTTYVVTSADVGMRLIVSVQARNAGGATTARASSAVIAPRGTAPASTAAPTIAGTRTEGQALTASTGGWTGSAPISYAYQWQRCSASGTSCANIPGATARTYALTAADVGRTVRVVVTATNQVGSTVASSSATGPVAARGPAGQVKLPSGKVSIPVTSVAPPQRLIVDRVSFSPNPVRSRARFTITVRVVDTRGYVVRDVLVFVRSTPLVTTTSGEQRTGMDGTVTMQLVPRPSFRLQTGYNVQFFVRARKAGENVLAGISTRRLVQVATASPGV